MSAPIGGNAYNAFQHYRRRTQVNLALDIALSSSARYPDTRATDIFWRRAARPPPCPPRHIA